MKRTRSRSRPDACTESIGTCENPRNPYYCCDPHGPWWREANENTNGLLCQYMVKRTKLLEHPKEDLQRIQFSLNERPRKILSYKTPLEKFTEIVTLST